MKDDHEGAKDWLARGLEFKRKGNEQAAETAFRTAIEINPKLDEAWYNLGCVIASSGKLVEAEEAFREAVALEPDKASGWTRLGRVLLEKGNSEAGQRSQDDRS